MIHPLDLMEPEETVGNLWHDWASRQGAARRHTGAAVAFEEIRTSVATLFRALGGAPGTEIVPAPAAASRHRLSSLRSLATPHEMLPVGDVAPVRLRLPPVMDAFPTRDLNRAAFLWLAALAAVLRVPDHDPDPYRADLAELAALAEATVLALHRCPGLRKAHRRMCGYLLSQRVRPSLPSHEAAVESLILHQLGGRGAPGVLYGGLAPRGYRTYAPVPIWLRLVPSTRGKGAAHAEEPSVSPALPTAIRKTGKRKEREQANRRDSFIVHRFESIMSWTESLDINRMVDDDDLENARKAAEDEDHLTLSAHLRRAASRLRVSLDLSPQDAEHERLAGRFTYPEWNHRSAEHMPDHCRVLEADARPAEGFAPDPRLVARVRRQFAPLHPRRVTLSRQIDGTDLDLDAAVSAQAQLRTRQTPGDRVWQASRASARDLSVAILMDCSRSTEVTVGERPVIDTAREALAALAGGIGSVGDRLAIWGFSSLRRDRVFLTRCKRFDEPMSVEVSARIGSLRPGHYTRLGAAIRHASAMLAEEGAARWLLLVLTDGKPNDLDHYEGVHGIEDSRMAVREARARGQAVHGVIVDADGQDWFARIFGRAGFTLLPDPARLPRALPEIYQTLTMER